MIANGRSARFSGNARLWRTCSSTLPTRTAEPDASNGTQSRIPLSNPFHENPPHSAQSSASLVFLSADRLRGDVLLAAGHRLQLLPRCPAAESTARGSERGGAVVQHGSLLDRLHPDVSVDHHARFLRGIPAGDDRDTDDCTGDRLAGGAFKVSRRPVFFTFFLGADSPSFCNLSSG